MHESPVDALTVMWNQTPFESIIIGAPTFSLAKSFTLSGPVVVVLTSYQVDGYLTA